MRGGMQRFWWWIFAALSAAACGSGCIGEGAPFTVGEADRTSSALSVSEDAIAATVGEGMVEVTLPVMRPSGAGSLDGIAEVRLTTLDGEEVGSLSRSFTLREGELAASLVLRVPDFPEGVAAGDLARYLVRYRVSAGDAVVSGGRSLYRVARRIASGVLGPDRLFADETAHFRLAALDAADGRPLEGAEGEVFLETTDAEGEVARTQVWAGATDAFGLANVEFLTPPVAGSAALLFRLHHASGATESRHSVTVQRSHRILLTTDKPLYQPGQTMHLRALATRLPHGLPSAGEDVTLEVQDGKGNKVFREETRTDEFGIASAQFTLARLVNMGSYTLRAIVGEAVQERAVTVDRYALPKFAVDFAADRAFYLPGERVAGQVDARYFFGQPVAGGAVTVRASQYDVDWVRFAELHGTTNDAGHWDFALDLPTYFVGLPIDQGGSFVKLEIEVTDTAGQVFTVDRPLTVAYGSVQPVLIPERAELAPGVANVVYLLTADPTGTPVSTLCRIAVGAESAVPVQTDDRGFASFEVTPTVGSFLQIRVELDDERGGVVSRYFNLATGGSATETVLLRTDKSLYAVGETAVLSIFTPRARDRVYLDAVREGQTMLSKIVEVGEGWTHEFLDIDPNLAGSVTFSVYFLADRGEIVRDQRVVFIDGADDLDLELTLDRDTYRPAETARLELAVRNAADGTPVRAAVGLQVVDEAVFALSESRPGLEKIYFELEQDIAQPSYEVHGYDASTVLGVGGEATPEEREDAARVLFAAAAGRSIYGIEYASERNLWATVLGHAQGAVQADARRIGEVLEAYLIARADSSQEAAERWVERMRDGWYDPWGQRYQADYEGYQLTLRSAGIDERWGTDDDLEARTWGGGDVFAGVEDDRNGGWADPTAAADAGAEPPPGTSGGGASPEVRIRQWFPETLYVNPAIVTDEAGRATVEIPLADSITAWRMTGLANSLAGGLGSRLGSITVFQEFFVDLSLPATLTLGDELTVPVVVYNYLDEPQDVELVVTEGAWFTLLSPAVQTLSLEPREVSSVPLRIRAEQVGWHDLEAVGRAGEVGDGLRRRIEVLPSGKQTDEARSDLLEATPEGTRVRFEFHPPADVVPGATELLVKLYPGVFAQAIEGLDSILKMPSGCFEQTSSATYPNVMALDYLQTTGTSTPEIELKAREYISLGYQRLLTYEVPGGGFEWFGSPPAHKILTAYGLMEFTDMAQVHAVDPDILTRTAQWLAAQQDADGAWTPDPSGIREGAINNYENDKFRTTAYILWSLLESEYNGPAVARAVGWLHGHLAEAADPYSRVIAAQALVTNDPADPVAADLLETLADEAHLEGGAASWGDEGGDGGLTYSSGSSHVLETTALVVDAFFRARVYLPLAQQGLTFLVRNKDSFGNWQTTQATVYALRAMLRSAESAGDAADATIDVLHNGNPVESLRVTPADYDLFRQIDLKELVVEGGANVVELVMTGSGSLMYQTVGTYWMPWDGVPTEATGPLSIAVAYDRAHLAVDDRVTATVTLTNNTTGDLMMVIADLGVPPGFDLDTEDLDALVAAGTFRRYEPTGRQVILYFDQLVPGPPVVLSYDLIARNPMRGEAPASTAYLYYDPAVRNVARPVQLEVD
ncbi:MAG: hypothetical protein JXB32_08795 [Deltaproteobacteria bacterium]|nr:hypothetical protein [Deltaproteobacteria bacterium]